MKIAQMLSSVSRRAGGVLYAVAELSKALSRIPNVEVTVHGVRDSDTFKDLEVWYPLSPVIHRRFGPAFLSYAPTMASVAHSKQYDVLHNHGIWQNPSRVGLQWQRRLSRPHVISTHGMLDSWALSNSQWKKRVSGFFFERRHLEEATCLHALCEPEYHAIRSYGLCNPVAVIPNGVDLPELYAEPAFPAWSADLAEDVKVILFLSRLHPKKGLVNLLHAWARSHDARVFHEHTWHLVVAGWDEGGYRETLEALVKTLGIESTVSFVGPQFQEQKTASLLRANAFVLPSFSEGLPMAVLEAWSYRLPILMTPQCNLPEGFQHNAALAIDPTVNGITKGLLDFFSMSEHEQQQMGVRGRRLVEDLFSWPLIANQMHAVYMWTLGEGPQPDWLILE